MRTLAAFVTLLIPIGGFAQQDFWQRVNVPAGEIRGLNAPVNGSLYLTVAPTGVYHSSNRGESWMLLSDSLFQNPFVRYTISSNVRGTMYLETAGKLYVSTDSGRIWYRSTAGLPTNVAISAFEFDSLDRAYAVGASNVYQTGDLGISWTNATQWLNTGWGTRSGFYRFLITSTQELVAAINVLVNPVENLYERMVFRSANGGNSWTRITNGLLLGIEGPTIVGLEQVPDGTLILMTYFHQHGTRLYKSTDLGTNWVRINFDSTWNVRSLVRNSVGDLFIGGHGVYRSVDGASSWSNIASGLQGSVSFMTCGGGDYLYALTDSGLFRSSQPTTEVTDPVTLPPKIFGLFQNYPNPFNPSTMIKYTLSSQERDGVRSQHVTLNVYDVLGREVVALVNEVKQPGTYQVQWDGGNQPSGVYFYQLTAGSFSKTMKAVLIR